MSRNLIVLTVLCGSVSFGGLMTDAVRAGSAPAGSPPVFVPPIIAQPSTSSSANRASTAEAKSVAAGVNPATTTAIISSLNFVTTFCSGVVSGYAIDCLAAGFDELSREYAGGEGYDEARVLIADAAKKLNRIARDNRSSTQKRARFRSQDPDNPYSTSRPLTPVDSAKLSSAAAQALVVIENTETLLLRSPDTSVEQAAQFQQIAEAIGSNKVLLRSL